jgi:hypothetical protein
MSSKKQPIADKKRPPLSVKTDKRSEPPTPEELQKFWDNVSWGYQ